MGSRGTTDDSFIVFAVLQLALCVWLGAMQQINKSMSDRVCDDEWFCTRAGCRFLF